jgi:hypothetical protein
MECPGGMDVHLCSRRVQPGADAHAGGRGMSPREAGNAESSLHLAALYHTGSLKPRDAPNLPSPHNLAPPWSRRQALLSAPWHHVLSVGRPAPAPSASAGLGEPRYRTDGERFYVALAAVPSIQATDVVEALVAGQQKLGHSPLSAG